MRNLLLIPALLFLSAAHAQQEGNWTHLLPSRDLAGWKARNPAAKRTWQTAAVVTLDPNDATRLFTADDGRNTAGVLVNGDDGKGSDLLTDASFGDCELRLDFLLAKGSNSGVYLMGLYEIQLLDSFGKPDADLKFGDCGGVYDTRAPSANAAKPPGQWQTLHLTFQAPRFDKQGKKISNAKFLSVKLNDVEVQRNVEVKAPTTSSLPGPERPAGPLLLQGDHGPVALRNIRIRPAVLP